MCGIAGFVGPEPSGDEARGVLERMTGRIAHRGPDEHGAFHDGPAHLGHRRLSIIDLASGQQPMLSDDGRIALTYNGEVYNHAALRAGLEAEGVRFATRSDTEVILRLYERYGARCVEHLRGMFAFAIWDGRASRLFVAVDRVGIKPVHYARCGRSLVFGSELKALLEHPAVEARLDVQALDDYFAHGFIRSPRTIYTGVRKLAPAHTLTAEVDAETGAVREVRIERYWRLPDPPAAGAAVPSYEEAGELLLERLDEAVKIRLMSEVPLGAFLSGGIDSSTVVWLMARHSAEPVRTFSIAFDEADYDERSVARAVASHFGTRHEEQVVRPDALAALPRTIAAHDEPFGDPSSIPTWYVCQMARRHVTVCLSGDGGDELFAGYSRYATIAREQAASGGVMRRRALALTAPLHRLESRERNRAERAGLGAEAHYARFRAIFSEAMRARLFAPAIWRAIDPAATARLFEALTPAMCSSDAVTRVQSADFHTYLPDDILVKVDRMSMDHALEARVPLLDHHVVELAASLPLAYKARGGVTKRLLRDLIEPHLPRAVLEHRKQGFSVPLAHWFRGELSGLLRETLDASGALARSGLFSPAYLAELGRVRSRLDLSWQLWQLVVFGQWLEQHPGVVV